FWNDGQASGLKTHAVTAVVLKTLSRTHTVDAAILTTTSLTHTVDAVIVSGAGAPASLLPYRGAGYPKQDRGFRSRIAGEVVDETTLLSHTVDAVIQV